MSIQIYLVKSEINHSFSWNYPGLSKRRLGFYCTRGFIFCLVNWFSVLWKSCGDVNIFRTVLLIGYYRNKGVDQQGNGRKKATVVD